MPIIVGAPRSGTTLLRFMLDAHPELAIPPETGFLTLGPILHGLDDDLRRKFFRAVTNFPEGSPAWPDFEISKDTFWAALREIEPFTISEGFRTFYRLYAARFGKSRWGDKTPIYCLSLDAIRNVLPESHFVHIIRDGRDVALSLRKMWFSPGDDMQTLAGYWRDCVLSARRAGRGHADYLEVRYEDLIQEPKTNLTRVCDYVGLSFDPVMLSFYKFAAVRLKEHKGRSASQSGPAISQEQRFKQQERTLQPLVKSRAFAWKREMSTRERRTFERFAGDALREFGYEA